jgi:hypothetical protein
LNYKKISKNLKKNLRKFLKVENSGVLL